MSAVLEQATTTAPRDWEDRRKVIFLDVDGVLNCMSTFQRRVDPKLEPTHCALLKKLVEDTGAKIVVSSTWRLGDGWMDLACHLQRHGIDPRTVIGKTADWAAVGAGGVIVVDRRGREIQAWLDKNPEVERFVILDDDDDMGDALTPFLVQTTFADGLTEAHVLAAKAILEL